MKRRIFFFTFLLYLPLAAEGIGDFALLVAGNVWEYETVRGFRCCPTEYDSSIITITLLNSFLANDTLYHCFQSDIQETSMRHEGNIPCTTAIDSSNFDTSGETL